MASYNRCTLVGNLTRDVELRYTPGGTAVADAGLAVNDKRKGADGEWIEEVTFVDLTFWARTAEIASEYLTKGSQVLIEGRLKLDQWEDKDGGGKRSKLKVVCEKLIMLGTKGKGDKGGDSREPEDDRREERDERQPKNRNRNASGQPRSAYNAPSDEIPF